MKNKKAGHHSPRSRELNMIIRRAALEVSDNGSIDKLAAKAGVSGAAIRAAIRTGRFTVGLACALELAVGREHIQREVLCDDLAPAYPKEPCGIFQQ